MDFNKPTDFIRIMENADTMYDALSGFDRLDEILAALGHTLDYWAFEHGVSAKELECGLKALYEASVEAHRVLGMPNEPYQKAEVLK